MSSLDSPCSTDGCARPTHDTERVCRTCQDQFERALRLLITPTGDPERTLLQELDATVNGQSQMRSPNSGMPGKISERPLSWNEHASQVRAALTETLLGWHTIASSFAGHGPGVLISTSHGAAVWALGHLNTIYAMPDAGDCVTQVRAAVHQAVKAVDRPPELLFCGPCDANLDGLTCTAQLFALPDHERVTCRECDTQWFVADKRQWLGEIADTRAALTAAVMANLLQYAGVSCTAATIRGLAHRERIFAVDGGEHPPRYLIIDVRRALADRYSRRRETEPDAA